MRLSKDRVCSSRCFLLREPQTDDFILTEKANKSLGTVQDPHYKPHELITNPPRPSDITLELLLASQTHLGHATSQWNPVNSQYIFGVRQGLHIISLEATAAYLRRACKIITETVRLGGLVLYVGTRPGQERAVQAAAERAGGCHLFDKWTPGAITNGQQMLAACNKRVLDANDKDITAEIDIEALEKMPVAKPDLVVCLNPMENWVLLKECENHMIPTIGVIDTNADPSWVTYPIPANDDSLRAMGLVVGILSRAGEEGLSLRKEYLLENEEYKDKKGRERDADRRQKEALRERHAADSEKDIDSVGDVASNDGEISVFRGRKGRT
jgi:small subunit ribosomal protein S2